MDPDCQFGLILKAYFKKEGLVGDVFGLYMRDNYFTRAGLDQSSFRLNVAACRLVLDILPGLEVAVLNDTEGLISQLYKWIGAKQVRDIQAEPGHLIIHLNIRNRWPATPRGC